MMDNARLVLRFLQIMGLIGLHISLFVLHGLKMWVKRAPPRDRLAMLGQSLVFLFRDLGATFIKIGQFLSTRSDLLPPPLLDALGELQDRVGPFPFAQVRRVIISELGAPPEEVFRELDPYPIASASISQVHRGVLPRGQAVAVKILRPGIEQLVRFDLRIMRGAARVLRPFCPFSPVTIVEEFSKAIWQQLDLSVERTNNLEFAKNFARDPWIGVPTLVDELCKKRVLCMELIAGEGILKHPEQWSKDERERLARLGYRMLLKMIFVDGFIHADLHPGNLIVQQGQIVMLDLGLVAHLPPPLRIHLERMLLAWVTHDVQGMIGALQALLPQEESTSTRESLDNDLANLMAQYQTFSLAQVQLGHFLIDIVHLLRRHHFHLQPSLTMTFVAIVIVEGLGRQLAPQLDLLQEAMHFFMEQGNSHQGTLAQA